MQIDAPRGQLDILLSDTRKQLIQFSQMADTKANILLSVSSVVLTLSLTRVTDPAFTVSIVILIVFLLMTIFLALLTVIPSLNLSTAHRRKTSDASFNPLFFGDYASLSYDEYLRLMEGIMNDSHRSYEVQVREIYFAGLYLARTKYRYVKLSAIFFSLGLS